VKKRSIEQQLAFLELGKDDLALLAELRPMLEAAQERFVGAFYRHLLSFEPTRRLLADPDVKDRLLDKQRSYLLSLTDPVIDERYVEERLQIGRVHESLGLEPRWYLGSYALYFSLLLPLASERHASDPDRAERTLDALVKRLLLDADLAIEAYIEARERELAYLNQELASEGRALARQMEERSDELRQTRRRARAAEELASVGTLAAGLAHEIGTPMGVIRGHAEMLEASAGDEKTRWRLRTITDQIDRISGIIQGLLNLSRPRAPVYAPVHLSDVVEASLAFLGEKFRRRNIVVERDLRRTPVVMGDAEKLQQVCLNLMLNAADAMPEGGTLRVAVDAGEAWVDLCVADSGPGIPEDELPRIFEAFYTSKESGKGSGLGLTVASGIVRDHGGQLEVESEPGNGSEFRVTLPIPPDQSAGEGSE
jgi:signal transduction histidine kinase